MTTDQVSKLLSTVPASSDSLRVRRMLETLSAHALVLISELCESHSPRASSFFALMMVGESEKASPNGTEELLIFAAEVAPVAAHFDYWNKTAMDRWLYLSTRLDHQRGVPRVDHSDYVEYHRGLTLMMFVDKSSVNAQVDPAHLVWLGKNWDSIETYVPTFVERSSVERDLVESVIRDANGIPTLSIGIL